MKPKYLLNAVVLILCLYACKKGLNDPSHPAKILSAQDSTLATQSLLIGKWNVVSDTTYAGVNTGTNPVVYKGQPGDYFDFRTDGFVYIKEGAMLDTLSFNVISGRQIGITSFMSILNDQSATCQLAGVTGDSLSIISPLLTPPGGPQQRMVSLSR